MSNHDMALEFGRAAGATEALERKAAKRHRLTFWIQCFAAGAMAACLLEGPEPSLLLRCYYVGTLMLFTAVGTHAFFAARRCRDMVDFLGGLERALLHAQFEDEEQGGE